MNLNHTQENTLRRVKVISGYASHARFNAECKWTGGYIPRQDAIPSPYCYSPTHQCFTWRGMTCILVETSHRRYEVFEVPADRYVHRFDRDATKAYLASKSLSLDKEGR